jgi:hypothetical protein
MSRGGAARARTQERGFAAAAALLALLVANKNDLDPGRNEVRVRQGRLRRPKGWGRSTASPMAHRGVAREIAV